MMAKELCIRCGKPTIYYPDTPITLRRYYIEGSGQLCPDCFAILYPVPIASHRPDKQPEQPDIPNKL